MEMKYLIGGVAAVVLILVLAGLMFARNKTNEASDSDDSLSVYRSEKIPEECRLPEYESDLNSWKEHLGHHQETFYCLEYYENVIVKDVNLSLNSQRQTVEIFKSLAIIKTPLKGGLKNG